MEAIRGLVADRHSAACNPTPASRGTDLEGVRKTLSGLEANQQRLREAHQQREERFEKIKALLERKA